MIWGVSSRNITNGNYRNAFPVSGQINEIKELFLQDKIYKFMEELR